MTTTRLVPLLAVALLACAARASLAAPTIKEQEVAPPWKQDAGGRDDLRDVGRVAEMNHLAPPVGRSSPHAE